jgi:hypothetical protein
MGDRVDGRWNWLGTSVKGNPVRLGNRIALRPGSSLDHAQARSMADFAV